MNDEEYEKWKRQREFEERYKREKREEEARQAKERQEREWQETQQRIESENKKKAELNEIYFETYISGGLFSERQSSDMDAARLEAEKQYREREKILWDGGYCNTYRASMERAKDNPAEQEKIRKKLAPSWNDKAEKAAKHYKRKVAKQRREAYVTAAVIDFILVYITMVIFYNVLVSDYAFVIMFVGLAVIAGKEFLVRYMFRSYQKYSVKGQLLNIGEYSLIKMQEKVRYYDPSAVVGIFAEPDAKRDFKRKRAEVIAVMFFIFEIGAFFAFIIVGCLFNADYSVYEDYKPDFGQMITQTWFTFYFVFEFMDIFLVAVKNIKYGRAKINYCPYCGTCNCVKDTSFSYTSKQGDEVYSETGTYTPTYTDRGTVNVNGKSYDAEITYKGEQKDYVKYNYRYDEVTHHHSVECTKCRHFLERGTSTSQKKVKM